MYLFQVGVHVASGTGVINGQILQPVSGTVIVDGNVQPLINFATRLSKLEKAVATKKWHLFSNNAKIEFGIWL